MGTAGGAGEVMAADGLLCGACERPILRGAGHDWLHNRAYHAACYDRIAPHDLQPREGTGGHTVYPGRIRRVSGLRIEMRRDRLRIECNLSETPEGQRERK